MDSKDNERSVPRGKSVGANKRNRRSQTSTAVEIMDPQKLAQWEKEKQKLEKKYDTQRKGFEKERKKIETERKAAEKKHHKFLKEKKESDRLKIQLSAEKEIWLYRKRKNNDAEALLSQITEKTKEWQGRKEEAKRDWDIIEKNRAEIKEKHIRIKAEREKLQADQLKLEEDKKEFEAKSQTLVELKKANEENKSRLSDMEKILKEGEDAVVERRKEYEEKDAAMKKRELTASERDTRLKKEHVLMEDLKKNVYFTFAQRRAEFIKQSKELSSEMNSWNSSYTELFSEGDKKVEVVD